jgi:hypothetical protein
MPKPHAVSLPSKALLHMAEQAQANLPEAVAPSTPNLVFDPNPLVAGGLTGTAGRIDYFIVDRSLMQNAEAIYGFESGLDKIVFVNSDAANYSGSTVHEGMDNFDLSLLLASNPFFATLPSPGTTVSDGVVWYEFNDGDGDPNTGMSTSIVTIDVALVGTDVLIYPDNPFAIA